MGTHKYTHTCTCAVTKVHVVLIGLLDSACVAESDRDDLALATYYLTEVELLTGEFHAWPCHFS